MDFGKQFERLLDTYRKPDGSVWSLKEIEEGTGGFVRGGYLTNLRKGRIRQPGWDRMKAIARVVGFPERLWLEEPKGWALPGGPDARGGGLKERLNLLFDVVKNVRTNKTFTNREVADLSFGRLTERDVEGLRSGQIEDLKGAQYLALSEVFGVENAYWYDAPEQRPTLDRETIEALRDEKNQLILAKMSGRSDKEKDLLLNLLDQLDLFVKAAEDKEKDRGAGPTSNR